MPAEPFHPLHPDSSLPPRVRKDADREPSPKDASVDPSPTPIVNGIPRGEEGEHS